MVSLSKGDDAWEAQALLMQLSGAYSRSKNVQPYSHLQFLSYSIIFINLCISEIAASYSREVLPPSKLDRCSSALSQRE